MAVTHATTFKSGSDCLLPSLHKVTPMVIGDPNVAGATVIGQKNYLNTALNALN